MVTTQKKIDWMKYIPKTWRSVIAVIMVVGVPATPFIKSGIDGYLDHRIEFKTDPIQKTQDSVFVGIQEQKKSYEDLKKNMEDLNNNVMGLQKWLIEHNSSNKKFGK